MELKYNDREIIFVTKEEYEKKYDDNLLRLRSDNPRKSQLDCEERIPQLKAMHSFCCGANDENIAMSWLSGGVPDGADIMDYISIATDDNMYKDVCDCFQRQVAKSGWRY